jgi:CRP-like cAMP-binding protein
MQSAVVSAAYGKMHFAQALREMPQMDDAQSPDLARTISRHSLAYLLCSISELFRHYDFDPLDLLIIHAILNANVLNVMKDPELDKKFSSMHAVEPDAIKQGISRLALSRFLNLPIETVRRRADRLKRRNILSEAKDGLIVTERNRFKFGNNHELQKTNVVLVRKLLRDLRQAGITGPDDL